MKMNTHYLTLATCLIAFGSMAILAGCYMLRQVAADPTPVELAATPEPPKPQEPPKPPEEPKFTPWMIVHNDAGRFSFVSELGTVVSEDWPTMNEAIDIMVRYRRISADLGTKMEEREKNRDAIEARAKTFKACQ